MFLYYRLVLHTLFREIEIMQHIFFCIEHSFPQCNVFKIYPCYYVWYSDFRGKKVILISTDFVSLSGYIFGVLEFLWQPYFQGTISRSDDIISTIFMDFIQVFEALPSLMGTKCRTLFLIAEASNVWQTCDFAPTFTLPLSSGGDHSALGFALTHFWQINYIGYLSP